MSESIPVDPRTGLPLIKPEEYLARSKEDLLGVASIPNAALSMPLTLVAPDPKLPGATGYIPFTGLGESLAGMGSYIGRNAATLGNALANTPFGYGVEGTPASRWGLRVPEPPQWMADAGQRFEENRADVKTGLEKYSGGILPAPDMNTPSGFVGDIVGSSVGAGAGITPASVVAALPRAAQIPASIALMTRGHAATNIPANLAIAAGQEGAADYFQPQPNVPPEQRPTTPPPPPPDKNVTQTATPASGTAMAARVATLTQPQGMSLTDTFLGDMQKQQGKGGSDLNISIPFGGEPSGPTFAQQGNVEPLLGGAVGGSTAEALIGLGLTFAAIAGGRAMYRRGAAVNAAARDTRINDPAYAAQVNDYHNSVIARGPGSGTLGGDEVAPPMPQGNAVHRAVTYLADKLGNDAAQDQNYMNMTASTASAGERMSSQLGNLHDTSMQHNQMNYFVDTGIDGETRVKIPAPAGPARTYATLDADRQRIWNEGMQAESEIQARFNKAQAFVARRPNATPDISDIRSMYFGKSTPDLYVFADRMRSDPELSALADQYRAVLKGIHEDLGANPIYGFYTPSEARDITATRGNAVPRFTMEGELVHPLEQTKGTNLYTGQASGGVAPIPALAGYVEQLYPLFKRNLNAQKVRDHMTDFMTQPGAPQLMTKITNPQRPHTAYYPNRIGRTSGDPRDPIVVIRTPDGPEHWRIDNPDIRNIISGDSLAAQRVYLDSVDVARRVYQKGTTGVASLATGRAMPLRNTLFTLPAMAVTARTGRYGGLLSRMTERNLPTGVSKYVTPLARGLDMPLNYAAAPFFAARNMADVMTRRFAELIHPNANNFINRNYRAMSGDAAVDAMHQAATNRWEQSFTNWKDMMGISGQSSPMRVEAPGLAMGTKAGQLGGRERRAGIRLETARIVPHAFVDGSWSGAARAKWINLQNTMGNVFNSLGEVGHDMWGRLNWDNPNLDRDTLAYEMRNLVGNPSRAGSSAILGKVSSALPYTNVSMQGIGRVLQAQGERPWATPVTIATGLGTAALASIFTHMRSAAHMDFMQNQLSLQQREANIALATSDDPTAPTMIPLPQEFRPAYAFMLDLMSKVVNILGARHDPDVFQSVYDGISHFLGSNITSSNLAAIRHGAVDIADFVNLPQFMGRVDWNAVLQGKDIGDAIHGVLGGTSKGPPPGQGYDAPLDSHNGQLFESLLSNTFGAVGHSLAEAMNSPFRYHSQGHSWLDSLGLTGRDWLQGARQSNLSMNNMLWETQLRLSVNPPIAEALTPSVYALQHLPKQVQPGMEGYVGKQPNMLPAPMTADKSVSSDMLIRQMLLTAHQYQSMIRQAMAPIDALRAQMLAVDKVGMDPAKRTDWMNARTRELADKWKLVQGYVADLDNAMSNMAGKGIRIQDIKWNQDSSQFR